VSQNAVLVVAALAVLLAAEAIYYLVRYAGEQERVRLRQRLRAIEDDETTNLLRERRVARSDSLDRLLRPLPFVESLEQMLLQTDLSWTVASVLTVGLMIGTSLAGLFLAAVPTQPMLVPLGFALGLGVPLLLVKNSRDKRTEKISAQMPDALDMLVRSLRAGHGLSSGFKLVATDMPVPIAVEFGRCFVEQNVGIDFRTAVTNMTERVPNNLDLKIFAVSVVVQHETGGNLVEILEQIAHTVRERYKFYGKLKALTAEGRVSAAILGGLPFVTAFVAASLNPDYMRLLIVDPIGRMMVLVGALLWTSGFAAMRYISKVDY